MPHMSSAELGWSVTVSDEVIKGYSNVAAYFDGIIMFDSDDPSAHAFNIQEISKNLQKHTLKLSS